MKLWNPNASLMPYLHTMARAMSVAQAMSLDAPVEMSFEYSDSAIRPPQKTTSSSRK